MGNHRLILSAVLLVTLLAACLRLFRLSNQSFWTDEISSITTARAPLDQIAQISATLNNCPPTYFLALRPFIGNSNDRIEFRARTLSAIAGSLSIPLFVGVIYFWRRRWDAALIAGLLLAINPLHLWYSQEVRAYALMLFFGLVCLLVFELARSRGNPVWWPLYFVSAIATAVTHKTGLIFPLACGLWHGFQIVRQRGRYSILSIHAAVLIVAFLLISLKSYPPPKEFGRANSILEIVYTGMTFIGGYSFGPSLNEIQSYGAAGAVLRHGFQVGILGVILLLLAVVYARQFRSLIWGRETSLLLLGVGVVALGALLSSFPYNVRYALPALFGFLALPASLLPGPPQAQWALGAEERMVPAQSGTSKDPLPLELGVHVAPTPVSCQKFGFLPRLLIVGLLAVALWADAQWFFDPAYRKGDSRGVALWLLNNQNHVKSWTVLPDYLAISIQWYLEPHPEVLSRFLPPKESQSTSFPPAPDLLVLGRRHHLVQPDKVVASYQAAVGEVQAIRSFAGFELYLRNPSNHP